MNNITPTNNQSAGSIELTPAYLDSIQDAKGLTNGQFAVLAHWTNSTNPEKWLGKHITAQVANFLAHCKGYRNGKYEVTA
jgi:hypothetical protein